MKYLIIDGMLNGTGIRDKYEGGYISLESLGLTDKLKKKIKTWLNAYELEHYNGYANEQKILELDKKGFEIATEIKTTLNAKVIYFSSATLNQKIV